MPSESPNFAAVLHETVSDATCRHLDAVANGRWPPRVAPFPQEDQRSHMAAETSARYARTASAAGTSVIPSAKSGSGGNPQGLLAQSANRSVVQVTALFRRSGN